MSYQEAAAALASLGLEHTPVALAMVDAKPTGVATRASRVISACALWRAAEVELFFATTDDHAGCAVGAHVMGMPLSETSQQELADAAALMSSVGYLPSDEIEDIPRVRKSVAGVVYGPLANFPLTADCAVVWTTPGQAMLLAEALHTTCWKRAQAESATLFGRPACSALARTLNGQTESLSLGCAGMRTFTEVAPALALFVVPGQALPTLAEDLGQTLASNRKMQHFYQARKDAFA